MTKPVVAAKKPYPVDVEENKVYSWCSCGISKIQPICDHSHKGTGLKSVKYTANKSETVYFCGCKQTKTPPLCDGSHSDL